MFSKLAKWAPLALIGVTVSTGWVATLETSDITSLASAVGQQMQWFMINSLLIAGIGLIMLFGFLVISKLYGILRLKKWGKRRR